MAYRKNVTDKQQADIEQAADHSAIRFSWFDGKRGQVGQTKAINAYDLQAQGNGTGSQVTSAIKKIAGSGSVIGSHNDKPAEFETPGKA